MDVQSQLLFIGSSAKTLKLWWQNERGLTNWSHEASTPEGVLSRPTATRGRRGAAQNYPSEGIILILV